MNQPVVIIVATALIQLVGWRWQQQQIAKTTAEAASVELAHSVIEQALLAAGKRITADAAVVGAHEAGVEDEQLRAAIELYHELQRQWDLSEDLLDHRVRVSFPGEDVQRSWGALRRQLDELDGLVLDLSQHAGTDRSAAHLDQIRVCRQKIEATEEQLAALARMMDARVTPVPR